jgi:aspartyl-tRNA(Asn)/glutamyl-tRNA(Gln) amidotransferase subunit A
VEAKKLSGGKILKLTVHDLSRRIADGDLAPTELLEKCLEQTHKLNDRLCAFITVQEESMLRIQAKQAEREIALGKMRSALHGIPIAIKDGIAVARMRNTAGSKILGKFEPNYDATVVKKLRKAGAIIFGKTNLHEFARGSTTRNPHYGTAKNPWDETRIPGGSSGGSAIAVAASMVPVALGEDTGGSIRIPSSFCGLVGIKPTQGLVSRYGVIPLAYSFDVVGPMSRDPIDAQLVLKLISGKDERDSSTYCARPTRRLGLKMKDHLRGLRVGFPHEYFDEELVDSEVSKNYIHSIETLERGGAVTKQVAMPFRKYIQAVWFAIAYVESSSFHDPWVRTRITEYGEDVRALVESGYVIAGTQYVKAQRIRRMIIDSFFKLFQDIDILAMPTTAFAAPKIGESVLRIKGRSYSFYNHVMLFTGVSSVTGFPSISIPNGLTKDKLPTGLQLMATPFNESVLVSIAQFLDHKEEFTSRLPQVS